MGAVTACRATVRRRVFELDDAGWDLEGRWPPEYLWVTELEYYRQSPDSGGWCWYGGHTQPRKTFEDALAFAAEKTGQ